jgi:hypothetical protein
MPRRSELWRATLREVVRQKGRVDSVYSGLTVQTRIGRSRIEWRRFLLRIA